MGHGVDKSLRGDKVRIKEVWEEFIVRVIANYRDYPASPAGFKEMIDKDSHKYLLLASALLASLSKEQVAKIFKHFKI